ncbi:uncharacterized protein LOC111258939 isoform X2 [Varroa jacobsoni]|uniref:uncharacterized protein LOC111258939 isoform X2 n=1 Tax=Varroa jacobsoni TaxID=62625 RepID=UPI000BF8FBE6|nr:uncharacterized protein LOC111258939 isoform X2 [Varroa jacobsoni]
MARPWGGSPYFERTSPSSETTSCRSTVFIINRLQYTLSPAGVRSLSVRSRQRINTQQTITSAIYHSPQMKKSHLPSSPFKPNQRPITSPIIRSAKPSANGQGRLSVFQTSQAITQGQLVSRVPLSASARHSDSVSFQVSPQNSGYINSSAMDNFGPAPDICYERSNFRLQ